MAFFSAFSKLFSSASSATSGFLAEEVNANVLLLRAALNGAQNPNKKVRLYIDRGGGRGQQAAGVNLLNRIVSTSDAPIPGLAFTGDDKIVEIVYDDLLESTVVNIRQLLGWQPEQNSGLYRGVPVTLIAWKNRKALAPVSFAFSGASDDGKNYVAELNAEYYLRLQPFLYEKPNELQFGANNTVISLETVPQLGGPAFAQRGIFIDIPDAIDWNAYLGQPFVDVLQWLLTNKAQYDIAFTYGIHTTPAQGGTALSNAIGSYPYDQVAEVVLGTMATQRSPKGVVDTGRPSIIVNLDSFDAAAPFPDPFTVIDTYLQGHGTLIERQTLKFDPYAPPSPLPQLTDIQRNMLQIYNVRRRYLNEVGASGRARFANLPSLAQTQAAVTWLTSNDAVPSRQKVLWIQLQPPFNQNLFNALLGQSTLPAVFEGTNTANVAVNYSSMYFHVARPGNAAILYPTRVLASNPGGSLLASLQDAANTVGTPLTEWKKTYDVATIPPEIYARPINLSRANSPQTDPYRAYFQSIPQVYRLPQNDRYSLAFAYLYQMWGVTVQRQLALRGSNRLALLGDGGGELEELYAALEANYDDKTGVLKLIPGAMLQPPLQTSRILTFFNTLLKDGGYDGLVLQKAAFVRSPDSGDIETITVTGSTATFGINANVTLVFSYSDLYNNPLQCDTAIVFTSVSMSAPGVDWIVLKNPSVSLAVVDGGNLSGGGAGATIALGSSNSVDVLFRYPTPSGAWLFRADTTKLPSVTDFFQMAGGVNLVAIMPPPLGALLDVGLENLEFVYDAQAKKAESLAFLLRLRNSSPVHLVGPVELDDLSMLVTISSPGDAIARRFATRVDGTFNIGAAVVTLSAATPQYVFTGELTEGEIKIFDLFKMFLPGYDWDPSSSPAITQFSFMYNQPESALALTMGMDLNWTFETPVTTIAIERMGLNVTSSGNAPATGTVTGNIVILPKTAKIALTLSAGYVRDAETKKTGWEFAVVQTGGSVDLGAIVKEYFGWDVTDQNLKINGLGAALSTLDGSWSIQAKTAEPWKIPFLGIALQANFRCGRTAPNKDTAISRYFARVEVATQWNGIAITAWYEYRQSLSSFGITWGILEGIVAQKDADTWQASLRFTEDTTIGSIIGTMVSWITGSEFGLEAPWSFLNSIKLSGLALVYTFNTKDSSKNTVAFDVTIGPIEIGFARIDSIRVSYETPKGATSRKVMVKLVGRFIWNSDADGGPNEINWDASKPGSAPAPPGNGNKYIDLRLLALGQHVTVQGLSQATTVQAAIALMKNMPAPEPGKLPAVTFDAQSSWLIGMEFGVLRLDPPKDKTALPALMPFASPATGGDLDGYAVSMQIVFNDPHLYGLRFALAGAPAKIFAGLDFQIMYRQVSESVGVYQAEITLPDVMRHLSVGAYSLTLPVFGIAVYTNGDFQVDIGFPWNQNFARSFTIEAIIYPGIPVIGSAGFYFGKLSSASTDRVPKATNGTFNPVLVFGFGMQIGFGKSIEYGILKAGFSVTAVGIIEGVLGKWNPYTPALTGSGGSSQLQGQYYFWLRGTVGVIGKVYGTVDFAIVKASVNVEVKLLLQITYETYVSIALTVIASVSVSVSIEIDFGLFSISVDFSFSMQLKETFTIDNKGDAPWKVEGGKQSVSLLRAPADARLRIARGPRLLLATTLNWDNLIADPGKELTGYLAPALTVARNEWAEKPDPSDQVACYSAMLFIDSVPSAGVDRTSSARKALGAGSDTPFETLAKMVARWTVAATVGKKISAADVDTTVVNDVLLEDLLEHALAASDPANPPIPAATFEKFLADQFTLKIRSAQDCKGRADATVFPMAPSVSLSIPAYAGGYSGYSYSFAAYNTVSTDALGEIQRYFNDLAVKVQQEQAQQPPRAAHVDDAAVSMAQWVFGDYALLIARQMVQAMRDGLRNFAHPLTATESPNDVLTYVNGHGSNPYGLADLFLANPAHGLAAGKRLTLGVTYDLDGAESFATIGIDTGFTGVVLARLNATSKTILRTGAIVTYSPLSDSSKKQTYTIKDGDDLFAVASGFSVTLSDLLAGSTVLEQMDILRIPCSVMLPMVATTAQVADSFTTIASQRYGSRFDATSFATLNGGGAILRTDAKITYPSKPDLTVQPSETLGDVAARFGVPLDALLKNGNILGNDQLIAVGSALVTPLFVYQTQNGDTLAFVASMFAATPASLGDQPANATVSGLFLATDADGKPWYLNVPHLGQFQVGELLLEAQRTLALQHLSGMTSRYYLHGLRLPTNQPPGGITPKTDGMWVRKDDKSAYILPPQAGLYALTGQQFPLPDIPKEGAAFTMTFSRSSTAAWLQFLAPGGPVDALTLSVDPKSDDAESIRQIIAYARGNRLDAKLTELGAGSMARSDFASYPFGGSTVWLSGGPVSLPYGAPPPGVPVLNVWALPDAMTSLPDTATRAVDPRFSLALATYDEATGATKNLSVGTYGWASTIPFTIKRIPPISTSPATGTTYELSGATAAATVLLEQLVAASENNDALFDRIVLCYASANGATTWQSAPFGQYTLGIAQVNLSTETRPPDQSAALRNALIATSGIGLLNRPSEFVRLLWEASVTRSGGFYLYYYDAASAAGIPDAIFDDKGEAALTMVVTYAKPADANAQNRLGRYMNAVVTGQSLDTTAATLVATAAPVATAVAATSSDSLASIGYRYYTDVADLAIANETTPLATGASILVDRGVFQAPPGGMALADIAKRFETSVQAIQDANGGSVPDPLPYPRAIHLPEQTIAAGTSYPSLYAIGRAYGCSSAELGAANAETRGIFAGSNVNVPGGPMVRTASVPPGVASLTASRPKPADVGKITNPTDAAAYLLRMYNLLGYRIAPNADFDISKDGLPVGPTTQNDAPPSGKIHAPMLLKAGDAWTYRQSVPYASFAHAKPKATAGLPDPKDNPYRGTGGLLQVAFDWQDSFGNRIVSTLTDAQVGAQPPYNEPPVLTGYTDSIVALAQWPSVASAWAVQSASSKAQVALGLSFDSGRYRGPVGLTVTDATTLVLEFTDPLDPQSAQKVENYTLVPNVKVTNAQVQNDPRFLTLSLEAMGTYAYVLTIDNVAATKASGAVSLSGQIRFEYPSGLAGTSVRDNAASDLRVYDRLYQQMQDPSGVAYTIATSLIVDAHGVPLPQPLAAAQVTALGDWVAAIYRFLDDRKDGHVAVAPPAATLALTVDLDVAKIGEREVFELTCSFAIARTGAPVLGELADTAGIASAQTTIAALTDPESPASQTRGLTTFATQFESVLSAAGHYSLKVATGIDRQRVSQPLDAGSVWAVRIGTAAGEAISYSIDDASEPQLFSPRPISNVLQTRPNIGLRSYTTGSGLSPQPDRTADFANIDMDVWGSQIFDWFDAVLSPQFTGPAQIVDHFSNTTHLADALVQKERLAQVAAQWMIPVYADAPSTWDPAVVREAFRQYMLVRLSNGYATRGGVQFEAAVIADAPASGPVFDAAITGPVPNDVLLRFGVKLQPASAQSIANYTIAGFEIVSATLSDDGKIVTLSLKTAIDPGIYSVTAANVVTADGTTVPTATRPIAAASSLFGSVLRNPTFVSATIPQESSTQLILRFAAALDARLAVGTNNYTIENGPTVLKATQTADKAGVELDLSSAPLVDSKVVVRNLTDTLGYPVAPDHQLVKIAALAPSGTPALTTTASRLPAWTQEAAPLAFLVNGSEVVRDDSGAVISSVPLDLRYDARNLEHQIEAISGAGEGYHASSWLQFVLTETPWPLTESLGAFDLPLPLRAFPATPALTSQTGTKSPAGDLTPIAAATRWTYAFTYTLPFHYPHDRVHGNVQFNVGLPPSIRAGFEDAFAQMAEFISVFPAVQRDLEAILAGIDATIDPQKPDDAKRIANASVALGAFVEMARDLADAASGNGLVMLPPPQGLVGAEALTFDFVIEESVATYGATLDALLVDLGVNASGGVTDPWVLVDIEGYVAEKRASKAGTVGFAYRKIGTKDQYLDAATGQRTPGRTLELRSLDVLQRQDAWPTIYVERNEELVPGKTSAQPFIYQTGNVQFSNPYPPTIVSSDVIAIQDIGKPGAMRSLQQHLTVLFDALLAQNAEPKLTIRVEVSYAYSLFDTGGSGQPIVVPIMLQAPLTIDVKPVSGNTDPALADMIGKWADAITGWFALNAPASSGTLRFDLGILSNLTQSPMPLADLTALELPLSAINPPLAVYTPAGV